MIELWVPWGGVDVAGHLGAHSTAHQTIPSISSSAICIQLAGTRGLVCLVSSPCL
jgi:hypothetical protein